MPLDQQKLNNLKDAATAALQCEIRTDVPCEMIVAQWALESGWGNHQPQNNCFGIKGHGSTDGQLLQTNEWFTANEVTEWLAADAARTAVAVSQSPNENGKMLYRCQDWFATFATLEDCFVRHAAMLTGGRYGASLTSFKMDHDLSRYVATVARIYATDPAYRDRIMSIIEMPQVSGAIEDARSK